MALTFALTANGLVVPTQAELITFFTEGMQAIYGADINLSQDTPDGQAMMIYVQTYMDMIDVLKQVYTSFDPDQAYGNTLDERVSINGIQRQAGTYTLTNITVVASAACSLYGLDQDVNQIYTVQDNAGNQWELLTSQVISAAGTYVFEFRAQNTGALTTIPNTITSPVTIVLGISSINNPTTYLSLGLNEESDNVLKIRRQKSVSIGSQGYLSGLYAALENINGVTSVFIYENTTSSIDGDGVSGHTIWVIVAGSASASDVANAIYKKRNAGAGMKGAQSFNILQVDNTYFTVRWDNVDPEDLYIKFDATSIDGINPPNTALILAQIPIQFTAGVFETLNINDLATVVQNIDPNCLVTNAKFSFAALGPFYNVLTPTAKNKQFAISSGNIAITVV